MLIERNGFFAWSCDGVEVSVRRDVVQAVQVPAAGEIAYVWMLGLHVPIPIDRPDAQVLIAALMEESHG